MFQSKKPNSSRKFRLRTDASRDTRCSRALNTQLPRVIAERAIHHAIVIDGRSGIARGGAGGAMAPPLIWSVG